MRIQKLEFINAYELLQGDLLFYYYYNDKNIMFNYKYLNGERDIKRELLKLIKDLGIYNKEINYKKLSSYEMEKAIKKDIKPMEQLIKDYLNIKEI